MDLTAHDDSINHSDRQAGACETVITEEMLDAGESVLCGFNGLNERLWAEEVYRAMHNVFLNRAERIGS